MSFLLNKLGHSHTWKRIFLERLTEPIHLNIISLFVAVFGTTRAKIDFDLMIRPQHAFCLLKAADQAREAGVKRITAIEFGVANGAGLLNICQIAKRITDLTGVEFDLIGFDSGTGMPNIRDYRDHPEAYQPGWYPMQNPDRLRALLTLNARLVLGEMTKTVPDFVRSLSSAAPIGFVSVDVDYHWSAVEALRVLLGPADCYLPMVQMYFDDVNCEFHNAWCGELAAINEFNDEHKLRKIAPVNFLRERRIFKNAPWISQIYALHVFDHAQRFTKLQNYGTVVLENPYG
jgi:hypothetical protein